MVYPLHSDGLAMRSNGSCNVTTTDVLIAMLSSDLRGSWAETGGAIHRREQRTGPLAADPAAGAPPPAMAGPEEPEPEPDDDDEPEPSPR